MKRYQSPTGSLIVGVSEHVLCTAHIQGFDLDEGGNPAPIYAGRTDVHWDTQEPLLNNGCTLYVDDNADEWTWDQLKEINDGTE